jgi:signal transduction histidine kinase
MLPFVEVCIGFCIVIGLAVLWANPHRFTNQAFAVTFLLVAGWLACVFMSMKMIVAAGDPVPWHRANTAVASFIPWGIWLLKESIVAKQVRRRIILQKSLPWLLLGMVLAALCYTDAFIERVPNGPPKRGFTYIVWEALAIAAYLLLTIESMRQIRRESGIRRIELQFWTANFGLQGLMITTLMMIGNIARLPILKDLAIILTFGMFAVTAWAITAHRVFDVRQVFLSLSHRLIVVVALCVGMLGITSVLSHFIPTAVAIFVAVAACSLSVVWLERASRKWFHLDEERRITEMRMNVITISRTEPNPDQLVHRFQRMLARWCKTDEVALLFDSLDAFASERYRVSKRGHAYAALSKLNWATPERLQRQRSAPELEALQQFLADYSIGLIASVPQGSPSPSLIVILGPKSNEWPFTYPEVVRIQSVAELMDNILTRSRLTTQAALKAKTEHLAMMSRGLAHDLKNLLTPVSSFLVHAEGRFPANSAEAEVHGAAQRSIRIMSDYVREARFFAEELSPQFEVTSLPSLLESVREITRARAVARSISLTLSTPPDVQVTVDRVLIQRLLGNLVSNAIDASASGQMVGLSGEIHGDRLRLQVTDQGCGIAPENLSRIFEAYFTTKEFGEDVRGFGLGLTICQKIVALHSGGITVRSELGHGSTFTVELPGKPAFTAVVGDNAVSGGAGI